MRAPVVLLIPLSLFVFAGCSENTTTETPPAVASGFPGTVGQIFGNHCLECHGATVADAGLRLDSWDEAIKGSSFGEAVIPFDAENSFLIEMVTKLAGGHHPSEQGAQPRVAQAGDTLTTAEVDTLETWINQGARNDQGEIPYANSVNRILVCSQDADIVSVIDRDAMVVIRNIKLRDLGYMVGSKPHQVAFAPDGSGWFVSLIGANRVLKFGNDYQLIAESPSVSIPALLGPDSLNNTLYVSRFMDLLNPQTSIYALDMTTMQPMPGEIPVLFPIPHCMAVSRSGNYVYTASLSQSKLIVIDAATNDVEESISLGLSKGPLQMAVSPDDATLYLSCQLSNQMYVIDVSDPSSRTIVDSISVAAAPWHPAYTPDGSHVYVGNNGADMVTVINTATRSVETEITGNGLAQPHGIAMSAVTPYVFVSNRNVSGVYTPRHDFGDNANVGTVVAINRTTNQIEKVIEIREFGSGMAIQETGVVIWEP